MEPCDHAPGAPGDHVTGEPGSEHRRRAGRALRKQVPRADHGSWSPARGRPDPVGRLAENNRSRLPDLVPVRYGRMLASPFAFLRGSAVIMADDLAGTPATGVRVRACGDAPLGNFGVFGPPSAIWFSTSTTSTRHCQGPGSGT